MSFKKGPAKKGSVSSLPEKQIYGLKPWLNCGLGLVSSGHRELDGIIGGGLALGTVAMLVTDSLSSYGDTLFSYLLADSVSISHSTVVVTVTEDELSSVLKSMPFNLSLVSSKNDSMPKEDSRETTDAKLTIAWQYGKYIEKNNKARPVNMSLPTAQSPLAPLVTQFCSSFDLSRSMQTELLEANPLKTVVMMDILEEPINSLAELLKGCMAAIITAVKDCDSSKGIIKILMPNVTNLLHMQQSAAILGNGCADRLFVRFFLTLQQLVRTRRALVYFTVPEAATSTALIQALSNISDSVFAVESFAGRSGKVPAEFREFQGFFYVHKLQQLGALAPFRPMGKRFGLKRDRRKLHIEPLHLPPEESRTSASQGGGHPDAINSEEWKAGLSISAAAAKSTSIEHIKVELATTTSGFNKETSTVVESVTLNPAPSQKKPSLAERLASRRTPSDGRAGTAVSISRKPANASGALTPGSSCASSSGEKYEF